MIHDLDQLIYKVESALAAVISTQQTITPNVSHQCIASQLESLSVLANEALQSLEDIKTAIQQNNNNTNKPHRVLDVYTVDISG